MLMLPDDGGSTMTFCAMVRVSGSERSLIRSVATHLQAPAAAFCARVTLWRAPEWIQIPEFGTSPEFVPGHGKQLLTSVSIRFGHKRTERMSVLGSSSRPLSRSSACGSFSATSRFQKAGSEHAIAFRCDVSSLALAKHFGCGRSDGADHPSAASAAMVVGGGGGGGTSAACVGAGVWCSHGGIAGEAGVGLGVGVFVGVGFGVGFGVAAAGVGGATTGGLRTHLVHE